MQGTTLNIDSKENDFMAAYTKVNLKEVEDQAPKFGFAPNIEARFANKPLELEKTGMSYLRIAPNFRPPFGHKHREQEEIYVLVKGSGRLKANDEIIELGAWDAVRLSPGTMRCFEAGPEGADIIAFGAPSGVSAESDAEMVTGWWAD